MSPSFRYPIKKIRREVAWKGALYMLREEIGLPIDSPGGWRFLINRLWALIVDSDIELAELQGSLLSILWGVWFFLPWYDTRAEHFPVFHVMMKLAPNEFWATLFLTIGLMQFWGVLVGNYRLRRRSCMASLVLWLFVGLFLAMGEWRAISCPVALVFSAGAGLGYVKMGMRRAAYTQGVSLNGNTIGK